MENRYLITLKKWSDDIDGTYFVVRVPELPGCQSNGKTVKEALSCIREAMAMYLDVAKEFGDPIPEPEYDKEIVQYLGEYSKEEREEGYRAEEKLRKVVDSLKDE